MTRPIPALTFKGFQTGASFSVQAGADQASPKDGVHGDEHDAPAVRIVTASHRWGKLIENDRLADIELGKVAPEDARLVAELCLNHAGLHALAVKVLLFKNPHVASEAIALLHELASPHPDDPRQVDLALCLLEVGCSLPARGVAPAVAELVSQRDRWTAAYEFEKSLKHDVDGAVAGPDEPAEHQGFGKPFLHHDTAKYSRVNRNGKMGAADLPFWCRHLTQVVKGEPGDKQAALGELSKGNVGALDYAALEAADRQLIRAPTINFSHRNFTALMQRLALHMQPGDSWDFPTCWHSKDGGHAMLSNLGKLDDREAPGLLKPALYEPNLTGDMSHHKAFPEKLTELEFDDYDTKKIRRGFGISVMALVLEDPRLADLARLCAGAFVDKDCESQVASIAQALPFGNLAELDAALQTLRSIPLQLGAKQLDELEGGVYWALRERQAAALDRFLAGLAQWQLAPEQNARILTATGTKGVPGLFRAAQAGALDVVSRFLAGLRGLNLTPDQVTHVVSARWEGFSCLQAALRARDWDMVEVFLIGLKNLGLPPRHFAEALGLRFELEACNHGEVMMLMMKLRGLDLPPEYLAEVLKDKGHDRISCLEAPLVKGHAATLTQFRNSFKLMGLDHRQMADVVGLRAALEKRDGELAQKMIAFLQDAGLSVPQLLDVAMAQDGEEASHLHSLLQRSDVATLGQVLEGTSQNAELTACVHATLAQGQSEVVYRFMAGLKALGVSPDRIAEIVGLRVAIDKDDAALVDALIAGLRRIGFGPDSLVTFVVAEDVRRPGTLRSAILQGHAAVAQSLVRGFGGSREVFRRVADWLAHAPANGRSFAREVVSGRSPHALVALSKFITAAVEADGPVNPDLAKDLLSALHDAQSRRRWYLAGARKNFASTNELKKDKEAYEAFKAAKHALKQRATRRG